ncbi:MAG: cell division protein ZipA [Halioglobus sp.]|nr:cell division protein ZipA [Halioglobus sp.]
MVIVGVLLIVAVLLDAWRRVRGEKRSNVKVKLVDPETIPPEPDADLAWLKELPNGGARVVERGDLLRAAGIEDTAAHDDVELVPGLSSAGHDDDAGLDWLEGVDSDGGVKEQPGAGSLPRDPDPEVFMLNVVARSPGGFRGDDILQILLACDLRFGDMNFFHRHEYAAGRGAIQFSVANMMQPGVFDIDNMGQLQTPGLVFFVTLPGPEDMMKAYDYMLETAQAVARNLGGDVLDESRSVLTGQATEHARQKIRELEQRLLAQAR